MKFAYFALFAACASMAVGDKVLEVAGHVALGSRYGMSSLLKRAEVMHRVRRQAGMLGPRAPEQCVFDCIETMDAKMTEAFPEVAGNSSDDDNMAGMILKSQQPYDAAKFEQFCDIYTPSARCLDLCPRSDMKRFTEKSLATVEYMCMERYDDFRKYGPCMDKAGNEIDAVCEQQCSAYERGLQKLENLTKDDNAADYDDYEISSLLNETCTYVSCLMRCDQPLMTEKCGQAAADLERNLIQIAFSSLDDLLTSATNMDFWPESCSRLGDAEDVKKIAATGNNKGGPRNSTVGQGQVSNNGEA